MKSLFVYILLCQDDTYYVGVTNNIERRKKEHDSGSNPTSYTASRLPVQLMWYRAFSPPMAAIKKEKQIKKWSQAKKEALINGEFEDLKSLAKKDFGK